ncbi:OmpA family protein [Ferruginibacter sp.]|uniref:OmpA/MotB family protein n=1 Tax=Ferruginibacter sp. TaxID=1940288 RepID=UPI002658593D|nr:OmpA family protein [Ferruginibacter sp.]
MKCNYGIILGTACALFFSSCVSKKVMKSEQDKNAALQIEYAKLQDELKNCTTLTASDAQSKALLDAEIASLKKQMDFLKQNNSTALKQLENLSVISGSQAESIKKSLDNIGAKDAYIQDLQSAISRKDSLNLALVTNLKGAIGNMDDKDINIKVDKGVVYIDISDKLLFKSGSFNVSEKAGAVLSKVATVLKNQPDIEFMVEGHTDNVPYKGNEMLADNWDLSVKRATAVVRILQNQYGLNPANMTAAGRSEYKPVTDNNTAEGKAANRRTRIVILPQLDQFFKLLEPKK